MISEAVNRARGEGTWVQQAGLRRGLSGQAVVVPAIRGKGACGSRSTAACRPRNGRTRNRRWRGSVSRQALVRGHGAVVAEFFDVGESRTVAWGRRPQAAALVTQLADPGRGWDAIVVGEYERAFYGSQYALMAPLFEHYGIQLWMPEAGGRVDFRPWMATCHFYSCARDLAPLPGRSEAGTACDLCCAQLSDLAEQDQVEHPHGVAVHQSPQLRCHLPREIRRARRKPGRKGPSQVAC
jgi:hypothetical protein